MTVQEWRRSEGERRVAVGLHWVYLTFAGVVSGLLPEASPPLSHVNYLTISHPLSSSIFLFSLHHFSLLISPRLSIQKHSSLFVDFSLPCIYYPSYFSLSCRFDWDYLSSARFGLAAICYLLTSHVHHRSPPRQSHFSPVSSTLGLHLQESMDGRLISLY